MTLEGPGARGEVSGDCCYRRVAGRKGFEEGGANMIGRAGCRLQVGETSPELGREELPHRLVLGEERTGCIVGGESDGLGGSLADTDPEVLGERIRLHG